MLVFQVLVVELAKVKMYTLSNTGLDDRTESLYYIEQDQILLTLVSSIRLLG